MAKTTKKEKLIKESDELNELLDSIIDDNIDDKKKKGSEEKIKKEKEPNYINFAALKENAMNKARDYIDYLVDFYLSGAILDEPYLRKKKDDDTQTLGDLLLQMMTSEYAIISLLEVIDEGGKYSPRNFEVLSGLQKSKMEIVKHYEAIKMNMENNYRNMGNAFIQKQESQLPLLEASGYGQKALINKIRENVKVDEFGKSTEKYYEVTEEPKLPDGVKFYKSDV